MSATWEREARPICPSSPPVTWTFSSSNRVQPPFCELWAPHLGLGKGVRGRGGTIWKKITASGLGELSPRASRVVLPSSQHPAG